MSSASVAIPAGEHKLATSQKLPIGANGVSHAHTKSSKPIKVSLDYFHVNGLDSLISNGRDKHRSAANKRAASSASATGDTVNKSANSHDSTINSNNNNNPTNNQINNSNRTSPVSSNQTQRKTRNQHQTRRSSSQRLSSPKTQKSLSPPNNDASTTTTNANTSPGANSKPFSTTTPAPWPPKPTKRWQPIWPPPTSLPGFNHRARTFLSRGAQVIVRMRGLPFTCTTQQILDFFACAKREGRCEVLAGEEGVLFVKNHDDKPTGDAFVLFGSEEHAHNALAKHRQNIGSRYVELFRSSISEVQQVLSISSTNSTSPVTTNGHSSSQSAARENGARPAQPSQSSVPATNSASGSTSAKAASNNTGDNQSAAPASSATIPRPINVSNGQTPFTYAQAATSSAKTRSKSDNNSSAAVSNKNPNGDKNVVDLSESSLNPTPSELAARNHNNQTATANAVDTSSSAVSSASSAAASSSASSSSSTDSSSSSASPASSASSSASSSAFERNSLAASATSDVEGLSDELVKVSTSQVLPQPVNTQNLPSSRAVQNKRDLSKQSQQANRNRRTSDVVAESSNGNGKRTESDSLASTSPDSQLPSSSSQSPISSLSSATSPSSPSNGLLTTNDERSQSMNDAKQISAPSDEEALREGDRGANQSSAITDSNAHDHAGAAQQVATNSQQQSNDNSQHVSYQNGSHRAQHNNVHYVNNKQHLYNNNNQHYNNMSNGSLSSNQYYGHHNARSLGHHYAPHYAPYMPQHQHHQQLPPQHHTYSPAAAAAMAAAYGPYAASYAMQPNAAALYANAMAVNGQNQGVSYPYYAPPGAAMIPMPGAAMYLPPMSEHQLPISSNSEMVAPPIVEDASSVANSTGATNELKTNAVESVDGRATIENETARSSNGSTMLGVSSAQSTTATYSVTTMGTTTTTTTASSATLAQQQQQQIQQHFIMQQQQAAAAAAAAAYSRQRNCIRLRGLPFEAQIEDVLYFLGDTSQDIAFQGVHLVYSAQGHPSGEAIIQMNSCQAAARAAHDYHRKVMSVGKKQRYIEVIPCSLDETNLMLGAPYPDPSMHHQQHHVVPMGQVSPQQNQPVASVASTMSTTPTLQAQGETISDQQQTQSQPQQHGQQQQQQQAPYSAAVNSTQTKPVSMPAITQ